MVTTHVLFRLLGVLDVFEHDEGTLLMWEALSSHDLAVLCEVLRRASLGPAPTDGNHPRVVLPAGRARRF